MTEEEECRFVAKIIAELDARPPSKRKHRSRKEIIKRFPIQWAIGYIAHKMSVFAESRYSKTTTLFFYHLSRKMQDDYMVDKW